MRGVAATVLLTAACGGRASGDDLATSAGDAARAATVVAEPDAAADATVIDFDAAIGQVDDASNALGCDVEAPPDVVQDPLCAEEGTGGVCVVNPPACCEIAGTCTLGGTPGAVCCIPTPPPTPAACAAAGGHCVGQVGLDADAECRPVGPRICGSYLEEFPPICCAN